MTPGGQRCPAFHSSKRHLKHISPQEFRGRRTISLRHRREADRQQMSAVACYPRGLTLILQHARPSLAPGAFLTPLPRRANDYFDRSLTGSNTAMND